MRRNEEKEKLKNLQKFKVESDEKKLAVKNKFMEHVEDEIVSDLYY